MNRRQFLKALGVGIVAISAPTGLIPEYPRFDASLKLGNYLQFSDFADKAMLRELYTLLQEEISLVVPLKYRHRVEYRLIQPGVCSSSDSFGQFGSLSWQYTPKKGFFS